MADPQLPMDGARVSEAVRIRVLMAAASMIDEHGYRGVSAAGIARRAGMSRASFYHHFANVEDCVVAVMDELVATVSSEISSVDDSSIEWQERVRRGVWATLTVFERQPALARACVLHSDYGRPVVLQRREEIFQRLVASLIGVVPTGGNSQSDDDVTTAEGVVAAALRILYSRLRSGVGASFVELHGDLVAIVLLPYVGPRAARLERSRLAPKLGGVASDVPGSQTATAQPPAQRPGVPVGGWIRLTLRTAVALEAIAANPGANNRLVMERSGISDAAQASRLLARLERGGLIRNEAWASGKWARNAWTLTPVGARLVRTAGSELPPLPAYPTAP